jgi:hypothetical protein
MKPAYLALSLAALFLSSPAYAQAPVQVAFALDPPIVVPDEHELRKPAPKKSAGKNGQNEAGDRRYAPPVDWTPSDQELSEIQAGKSDVGVIAPPKIDSSVPEPPKPPGAPAADGKPTTDAKPKPPAAAPPSSGKPVYDPGDEMVKPRGPNTTPGTGGSAPTLPPPKLESPIGAPAVPNVPIAPPVSVPGPGGI